MSNKTNEGMRRESSTRTFSGSVQFLRGLNSAQHTDEEPFTGRRHAKAATKVEISLVLLPVPQHDGGADDHHAEEVVVAGALRVTAPPQRTRGNTITRLVALRATGGGAPGVGGSPFLGWRLTTQTATRAHCVVLLRGSVPAPPRPWDHHSIQGTSYLWQIQLCCQSRTGKPTVVCRMLAGNRDCGQMCNAMREMCIKSINRLPATAILALLLGTLLLPRARAVVLHSIFCCCCLQRRLLVRLSLNCRSQACGSPFAPLTSSTAPPSGTGACKRFCWCRCFAECCCCLQRNAGWGRTAAHTGWRKVSCCVWPHQRQRRGSPASWSSICVLQWGFGGSRDGRV